MAEPTQFSFNWRELAELLIKQQDIHEGSWMVAIEFNLNVGVMGQSPAAAVPGVMVQAGALQLLKANEQSPKHLVVDAAVVNPAKKRSSK